MAAGRHIDLVWDKPSFPANSSSFITNPRHTPMRKILFAICFLALPALAADIYTFDVSGPLTVSGPGGVSVLTGWGYSIHNDSTSFWLVTTHLSAGTFQHATPELLFDFADLAPGAT